MMRGLILDTSTERGVVALFEEENVLLEIELPFGIQTAQFLIPQLKEKLDSLNIDIKTLNSITVGVGPGSYTGIRIGATFAKTLAFALKIPLVGICTLDAFIPTKDVCFAVLIDAKVGGAYMQKGLSKNGKIEVISPPAIIPLDELAPYLTDISVIVTPYKEKLKLKLDTLYPANGWSWEEKKPSCRHLLTLSKKKMSEKTPLKNLELLYMRKTQAEINRDALLS